MSLGIAFKGPEGIVLAADSRVTLTATVNRPNVANPVFLPATYDNATKLLSAKGYPNVGAVTYGAGAIGTGAPRTAHSFIPEFEQELAADGVPGLSTQEFAQRLADFFSARWQAAGVGNVPPGHDMYFLIGGYDEGEAYGRIYEIGIPNKPNPVEHNAGEQFGIVWGGQREYTQRLLNGFDEQVPELAQQHLGLNDQQKNDLMQHLKSNLGIKIPYQFLPLQDSIDVAIFLIRTTAQLQTWLLDIRGVGGSIDVATVTRTTGLRYVQRKEIKGESHAS